MSAALGMPWHRPWPPVLTPNSVVRSLVKSTGSTPMPSPPDGVGGDDDDLRVDDRVGRELAALAGRVEVVDETWKSTPSASQAG
jgi:hypothetical protein